VVRLGEGLGRLLQLNRVKLRKRACALDQPRGASGRPRGQEFNKLFLFLQARSDPNPGKRACAIDQPPRRLGTAPRPGLSRALRDSNTARRCYARRVTLCCPTEATRSRVRGFLAGAWHPAERWFTVF